MLPGFTGLRNREKKAKVLKRNQATSRNQELTYSDDHMGETPCLLSRRFRIPSSSCLRRTDSELGVLARVILAMCGVGASGQFARAAETVNDSNTKRAVWNLVIRNLRALRAFVVKHPRKILRHSIDPT